MTDKYAEIKRRLLAFAQTDDEIKCIVAIGSSTRADVKADEFSDLDLIIACENTEKWLSGEYPALLGDVSIAFTEPVLDGGKEYRAVYDNDKDVDMIIFTPGLFESAIKEGASGWVMNRGYNVLCDKAGFTELIQSYVKPVVNAPSMTENEFVNMVNDFYFHNIWAYKKLSRGELWSAKMCTDSYLKNRLLKVIELYSHTKNGADVWHDGRFIDSWADESIRDSLRECFAHYDKADIEKALINTHRLFAMLARQTAEMLGFCYPERAEKCAADYLQIS